MGARPVRRLVSVIGLAAIAVLLLVTLPVWLPVSAVVDLVRRRWRLPLARLLAFALCWAWLELSGVTVAGVLWLTGQARRRSPHFRLQRWWARNLLRALKSTCGVTVSVDGAEGLGRGPFVALCRHASLADSLVSAWLFGTVLGLDPRYVLKRELTADPCLDIVGHRLPNYFVDRSASDTSVELAGIRSMTDGIAAGEVAVIFAEGTRSSASKRERVFARMTERDPQRAARMNALRHLLPPKISGPTALVESVPDADLLLIWHVGFDGLDTFGGILRALSAPMVPVRFVIERHRRSEVPSGEGFAGWLDARWLEMDQRVAAALGTPTTSTEKRENHR